MTEVIGYQSKDGLKNKEPDSRQGVDQTEQTIQGVIRVETRSIMPLSSSELDTRGKSGKGEAEVSFKVPLKFRQKEFGEPGKVKPCFGCK